MRKVNLHFKFTISQFIKQVRELSFEALDIELKEHYNPDDRYVYAGSVNGLWIVDDMEIVVSARGLVGFTWTLDLKIGNKKLTAAPIEGRINERGISIHNQSYSLP